MEDNFRMNLKKMVMRLWTGFMWFRVGTCGRLLWTW